MKHPYRSLFRGLAPVTLIPFIVIQAFGQGQYTLDGVPDSINTTVTYDGESIGDTHIPQPPYFEGNGQRDAFLVYGNGSLMLSSGANVTVANAQNRTAFARVGYGTHGSMLIQDGSSFAVGHAGRYANFHLGHDATGSVTQTGGTASFIGSVNIGANGGTGIYNISGGAFTMDQTEDGGTSLMSVGFNNAADTSSTSVGSFNISGGQVNILSSHGGSSQFIIGNRVNTALGTSDPSGSGHGTVNQTGGVFTIGAGANLYLSGYGNGAYNLSGGSLEIGGDSLQARYGSGATGTYDFNFSGGSIVVTGSDLVTDVDINVTAGTLASYIDTNGFNATLSGNLTGAGTLVKTGAGNLNLSGNNNLSNGLYVIGGAVNQTAGTSSISYLAVASGGGTGTFTINGGSLDISTALQIGDFGGTGTFTINGGDVRVGNLGGASLNIGNQGGNGTLNVQNGSLTLGAGLHGLGRMDNRSPETAAGSGTINVSGGLLELTDSGSLILGDRISVNTNTTAKDAFGSGTLNQTGGIVRITDGTLFLAGHGASGTGTYNLDGGALEIGGNSLQARYNNSVSSYQFNLGGGTLRVIGSDLVTNADLTFVDTDPTSVIRQSFIDTNGFNATLSGNLTGDGTLVKTGTGDLNLSGNNNLSNELYVIGGAVNQTAGNSAIRYVGVASGSGTTGSYTITEGSLDISTALQIGDFGGTGTFTINGGDVRVGNSGGASLNIGNQGGNGTLNVQNGSLTLGAGLHGLGRMDNRPPATAAGSGTINVSGGLLELTDGGSLILGDRISVNSNTTAKDAFGSGTLNHTGGIVRITDGTLFLAGHGASGTGTYNLDGGALEIGGNSLQARYNNSISSYQFNLGGGAIRVIGSDLVTNADLTFVDTDPTSVIRQSFIDTNGFNATLSGNLTGDGTLVKIGTGDLNLSGNNNLSNELYVIGGAVNQTAGNSSIRYLSVGSGNGSNSNFDITGGSLEISTALQIGDFGGNSVFTIDGGAVTVGSLVGAAINIGNQGGTGILNLKSGNLTLGYGQHSTGRMDNRLPGTPAGSGTINVSGGLLEVIDGGSVILGDRIAVNGNSTAKDAFGSGTLNQDGGIVRVSNGFIFVAGFGADASGTYNLNGGTLEIGGSSLLARYNNSVSSSNFNLGGGELKVIGSRLATDVHFNLVSDTDSQIDTSTFGASVSGFNGTGNLIKVGLSDLVIATDSSLGNLTVGEGSVSTTASVTVEDLHLGTNTTFTGSGFIQVNGYITGNGSLQVASRIDGTLAVGNSPGSMALTNDMTVGGGATFEFDLTGNTAGTAGETYDQITLSLGTFTMEDGATFAIIFDGVDFTSSFWEMDQSWLVVDGDGTGDVVLGNTTLTGSEDYSSYGSFNLGADGDNLTLSWTAVPEPATAALLLAALAPLAAMRRRNH